MIIKSYGLPEWDFVAGETQKRRFMLVDEDGKEYDFSAGKATFSVVDFINRSSSAPVLTTTVAIIPAPSGKSCEISITLNPEDTLHLKGKYIYQLTISDGNGNIAIPTQGIMLITENIDKQAIAGMEGT